MENNSRYNDNYPRDFEGRLKYVGKNMTDRTDRILAEFLHGHYTEDPSNEMNLIPDPLIKDDQAVVANIVDKGLVILTGCGHACLGVESIQRSLVTRQLAI